MRGDIYKGMCIAVVVLLIAAAASFVVTANASAVTKAYDGPKVVFEDRGIRDKPDEPPEGKPDKPPGKPPKPPEEPPVDKWAVVIGISDYMGVQNDLQYCDDDARDMYDYLLANGYPEGNIKLLVDRKASARAIMKAIYWLDSKEGPDSEVVFFYSGHGSTYDGYDDGDAEYTDEAIVSSDLYLILDGQLRQKFSTFSSGKISITFDTCFSGGMDDLQGSGRVVVAACSETQSSYDGTAAQQNGVFTYYYMDGLNAYNTVEGAFAYAAPLAHDFVEQNYEEQMDPQMYDLYGGDWAF